MAMKQPGTNGGKLKDQKWNAEFTRSTNKIGHKRANEIGGIGGYLAKSLISGKTPEAEASKDVRKEQAPKYRREALQKLAREKSGKNKPLPLKVSPRS